MARSLRSAALLTVIAGLCACAGLQAAPERSPRIPWKSGERMVYESLNRDETRTLGYLALSIHASRADDQPTWKIESRDSRDSTAYAMVEVDAKSFLPIHSLFRKDGLGEIEAHYQQEGVSVSHRLRQDGSKLKQRDRTYEIFQSCYLMRRFPVQNGYQEPVYLVDSTRPAKQIPALMRITEIKTLSTIHGDQLCYKVTTLVGESRMHFWIGIDEKRWIYRIENEGIGVMRLINAIPDASTVSPYFEGGSPEAPFRLTLPADWLAFPVPDSSGKVKGEQITILPSGGIGSLTLSRHPKMVTLDQVYNGSINWLKENRKHFSLDPSSVTEIRSEHSNGRSFTGTYQESRNSMSLFHALVEQGEHLYIFTAHSPSSGFLEMKESLHKVVESLQSVER